MRGKINQPSVTLSKGNTYSVFSWRREAVHLASNQVIWWSEMNGSGVEWLIACGSILSCRNTLKRYSVHVGYVGGGCEKSQSAGVWIDMTLVFSFSKITSFFVQYDLLLDRLQHGIQQERKQHEATPLKSEGVDFNIENEHKKEPKYSVELFTL